MFLISELNLKFMNVRKVDLAFKVTTAQASVPGSPPSSTQNSLAFSLFWDMQAYVKLRNLQLSLTLTPAKPPCPIFGQSSLVPHPSDQVLAGSKKI